jgi:FtsP/CotA-like multicopper oxidase with cupredoxin domain
MSLKDKNKNRLQRREFLKLSTSGIAVYLSACAPDVLIPPPVDTADIMDPEFAGAENWQEPWTWRPALWPDSQLDLNVVRSQNPGLSPSPGNPAPMLFSYNGASPGPSIRVRSDGVLRVKVRNNLDLNKAITQVGPSPDSVDLTPGVERRVCVLVEEQIRGGDPENPRPCNPIDFPEQLLQVISPEARPGWSFKGHVNGRHAAHTTNLHTHGLHVFPQKNPDGTYSDDVHLRIIPNADWEARLASDDSWLHTLAHHEHVGSLDYKMQLAFERNGEMIPHPPGTHWYHPHSHGSTHDQVSSGMAGFLIVEGDIDDAINTAMTGEKQPNPETNTGPFDYRERLIFIQRVMIQSLDKDAGPKSNSLRLPPIIAVNGTMKPGLIRMRPGTVERWRVLNGSVDGAGTKRFMILDGHYIQRNNRVWRVFAEGDRGNRKREFERVTEQDFENAKLDIHQLSLDGITLVTEEDGKCRHTIRDLSRQNAGTKNPFAPVLRPGENEYEAQLRALESVFKDGDSLRRSFVRPNEIYLTNANRADLFFKAPVNSAGRVFTIFAKEAHIHTDNFQRFLQKRVKDPKADARRELFDVIVGHIHIEGEPVEGGDFNIQDLNEHLPPVPPFLWPVGEEELVVSSGEAEQTGAPVGSKRCRTIGYSGAGGADFPLIEVPEDFANDRPELENLVWSIHDNTRVLLPNLTSTMAINTEFDLAKNPVPDVPRKFMPADEQGSRMLLDTAEEWVLYNSSMMMWSQRDLERVPQPGSYRSHYHSYPLTRAEGQRRFAEDPDFMISVKANDHPFHIHINPMWVLRIDVPDENGELHNILPEPTWMDTVAIPRQGGRVVFRSRFDDFVGKWVNHCHVLSHEDLGMMQEVECTDDASRVNYNTREKVALHAMSSAEVDAIYPRPSLEIMYQQNMSFIDPNEVGYQVYPGFDLKFPKLTS